MPVSTAEIPQEYPKIIGITASEVEITSDSMVHIATMLENKTRLALEGLFNSFTESGRQDRVSAILHLGIASVGNQYFYEPEKPSTHLCKAPGWITYARGSIHDFVRADPTARQLLLRTIFFDDDVNNQENLNRIVYASVVPAGAYDERSFINGIASGRITTDVHTLPFLGGRR